MFAGVDIDGVHPQLSVDSGPSPGNTSGWGSVPSNHRPNSSGISTGSGSLHSVHNPGLITPTSASPSQRFQPNFPNDSRTTPSPSVRGVNAGSHGWQQPVQKTPNSSVGNVAHPAVPARLSGEQMTKRPETMLKSHDYEELPSSR